MVVIWNAHDSFLFTGISEWYSAGLRTGWSGFRLPVGAQPSLPYNGYQGHFGVKRQEREADHSTPSTVEVKNEWS